MGASLSPLRALAFVCYCWWMELNRRTTNNSIGVTVSGCGGSDRRWVPGFEQARDLSKLLWALWTTAFNLIFSGVHLVFNKRLWREDLLAYRYNSGNRAVNGVERSGVMLWSSY